MPLFTLHKMLSSKRESAQTGLRTIVFMSPFYLWLGIFSFQPHKEERFMYPVYPALALNAAMALHIILVAFGNADPKTLVGKIPARLKLFIVSICMIGSIDIGLARMYGVYNAYSAPLKIYEPLRIAGVGALGVPGDSVCFGKDWYRFPTSYFLPNGMRAKFIKSEFNGLLPGEFAEARTGFGFWSGAWLLPAGMNDQNMEDPGKYVSTLFSYQLTEISLVQVELRTCSFLVDTYFPGSNASQLEPHYILDTDNWQEVTCVPFLDASRTHILARTLWLPNLPMVPEKYRRHWGQHCLLRRKANR
jgi:alpha-1,2-mannosyltransferase